MLGFATIGFALIYVVTRYNSLYVLTNNIDTKGIAYARALQQLMTGVYISEVCLIGLFAINTAPGPIVLMVVFLVFTALYHALMRHALLPLTRYLPSSTDGDHQLELFSHDDIHSYDESKANAPPSHMIAPSSNKFSATKKNLFTKIFDPRKFASHNTVRQLIPAGPNYPPPQYTPREEENAYYNPAITAETPKLWIVKDDFGISTQECQDSGKVVGISDDWARFDAKAKVEWMMLLEGDKEGRGVSLQNVPVWEKRVDY